MMYYNYKLNHYKYKLNHFLSLLPARVYAESMMVYLDRTYGISSVTFNRDRYIKLEDVENIPLERLEIYAKVFEVTVDQLVNHSAIQRPNQSLSGG